MNWDLILTTVGLFTTVVIFAPIFTAMALAYYKSKTNIELEAIKKHGRLFHPSNDDIDWTQFYEGETK